MAEKTLPKIPLPRLLVTSRPAKKPKKRKTEAEKAATKKALEKARAQTRVNIGAAFGRWRQLRAMKGLKSDADVAFFLLDRAKCLQQDGAESKTTRVDCSQGSYEEIEVTIDGDDRNSVKNSLSDFDSDMENIEETNEQSISGADDSCEDDVSVSILPQRSIKSEPLLECKEEESEPLQNDTLQVHVKKQEEDVGEFSTSHQIHEQHGVEVSGLLNNGLVDCKPEPSSPQSCSAALHTPKTETDDVEVHQFSNKPAFSSSDWTPEPNIKTEF